MKNEKKASTASLVVIDPSTQKEIGHCKCGGIYAVPLSHQGEKECDRCKM